MLLYEMKFSYLLIFSIFLTTNILAFKLVLDSPKAESADMDNSYIVDIQIGNFFFNKNSLLTEKI